MQIPPEIVVLIEAFYVPNKLIIDSFKFQWGQSKMYWDLWESTGVDTSYWMKRTKRLSGIIFVIDLSSYDEYFVDENGEKKNKLEYAHSVWTSWKQIGTRKLTLLTKKDLFQKKIKEKPLNICPLFSEIDQQLNQLSLCLGHIREKFKSVHRNRLYVLNTGQLKEIQNYFKVFIRAIVER